MNNLRIDLILETERRSTSPVSLRFVARIAGLALAAVVVLIAVSFVIRVQAAKSTLRHLEAQWKEMEPKQKQAQMYQKELERDKAILAEIRTWNKSRLEWYEQMAALEEVVPETIQISKLDAREDMRVLSDGYGARFVTVTIEGRARGEEPEKDIEIFRKAMEKTGNFTNVVENAKVIPGSFREDRSTGAQKHHRVFGIDVKYKPRKYAE